MKTNQLPVLSAHHLYIHTCYGPSSPCVPTAPYAHLHKTWSFHPPPIIHFLAYPSFQKAEDPNTEVRLLKGSIHLVSRHLLEIYWSYAEYWREICSKKKKKITSRHTGEGDFFPLYKYTLFSDKCPENAVAPLGQQLRAATEDSGFLFLCALLLEG